MGFRDMTYLLILLLLLGGRDTLCAQQAFSRPMPFFSQLSSNEIVDMYQDGEGYIWLGTTKGLERYDGYELQPFKSDSYNPTLLSSDGITCISDDERYVWIGTRQGLDLFDKVSCLISPFPGNVFQGKSIRYMMADKRGYMWVAVGQRLFKCGPDLSVIKEYNFLSSLNFSADCTLSSMYQDHAGNVWALSWGGGLFKYIPEKDAFVAYPEIGERNRPFSMFQDRSGRYWIATWGDGLWAFFPEKPAPGCYVKHRIVNSRGSFSEPIFYNIAQDNVWNYLWVLSYNELYAFRITSSGSLEKVGIHQIVDPYKMYTKILKDRDGNLWLGSYDMAYHVFFDHAKIENYPLLQLKEHFGWDPNLIDLCLDKKGIMWINQDRYGLCMYDPKRDTVIYNDIEGTNFSIDVNTIVKSGFREDVWVGHKYDPHVMRVKSGGTKIRVEETIRLEEVFPGSGRIRQILEDKKGNLWILTSAHLFVKPIGGGPIVYDKKKLAVSHLAMDRKGGLWASSSDRNIYRLNYSPDGISGVLSGHIPACSANEKVERFCVDGNDCIWLSTSLGRICRSDVQKQKFEEVSMEYIPKNSWVLNLLSDDQFVWIVTNNRVFRYDIQEKKGKGYSASDGNISVSLFRNEAACLDGKGGLYVGGHGGFVHIQAEGRGSQKKEYSRPVITDVRVGNNSLFFSGDSGAHKMQNTLQQITLDPDDRNIEILFSSLNYFPNQETQYAYKLEGVDADWIYPGKGKHSAFYNRIGKGTYTFWLKSMDGQGQWGEGVLLITLRKLPAFYETWYAYLLYALAAGLLVYGSFHMYLRRVQRRHAAKLREELTQSKLNYFTHISHELLTPLTVISCAADYLEANAPAAGKMIGTLRTNVDRLKRLLQQMLDFRRVEHGKMILKVSRGDVLTFIRDLCTANFMPLARKKNIAFHTEIGAEELWGYLDFDKVDKILYNLLSNAVKYTPEGKQIRIVVQTEYRESHHFLIIRVEDEGIGIALKERERIFEQFYTNERNRNVESNGIGLSLTKALVVLHRGTIRVESVLGEGSCFIIELPIDKESYPETERVENVLEVAGPDAPLPLPGDSTEKSSVLLVEDNAELLDLMKDVFFRRYNVLTASGGLQAWDILEGQQADVVVSDVMMPQMDGWELCRKIKSDLRFSHIPVIMLTAKNGMDDRVASYEAGADGYIAKPFEMEVLFARIDNLVKSYKMRQTLFRKEERVDLDGLQYKPADKLFLQSIINSIENHLNESDFDLELLAADLNMSKSTLYRKIKGMTGLTPLDLVRNVKLKRACTMLEESRLTISEIAYAVGFSNPKYFTKCFKEEFEMTPSEYQQKHLS